MSQDNWRQWENSPAYGEYLYKRATGQLEEMESSKAVCKVLSSFYKKGMSLADVGCGAGHYLLSLRKRLDQDIDYTGFDATSCYLELAKKAFPQNASFIQSDIYDLRAADNSFDVVMSNNVLLHLPPGLKQPISELMRISKQYVVIRTLFGERNYVVKAIRGKEEGKTGKLDDLTVEHSEDMFDKFGYYNMYTVDYFRDLLNEINPSAEVEFIDDDMWEEFDNRDHTCATGTRILGKYQVSGNLLLDWKFIVIKAQ